MLFCVASCLRLALIVRCVGAGAWLRRIQAGTTGAHICFKLVCLPLVCMFSTVSSGSTIAGGSENAAAGRYDVIGLLLGGLGSSIVAGVQLAPVDHSPLSRPRACTRSCLLVTHPRRHNWRAHPLCHRVCDSWVRLLNHEQQLDDWRRQRQFRFVVRLVGQFWRKHGGGCSVGECKSSRLSIIALRCIGTPAHAASCL